MEGIKDLRLSQGPPDEDDIVLTILDEKYDGVAGEFHDVQ